MNDVINKKELKKQSRDFRTIANRTLTSDFQMFNNNLKRLLVFIKSNHTIMNYINSCIDNSEVLEPENEYNQVCGTYGCVFENYLSEEEEVAYTFKILEFIVDNNKDCRSYILGYSTSTKYQDKLKGFCDNVIEPFINYIDGNYERIFIEMGMDENAEFKIINNGGQVNIAKDYANINANQINNNDIDLIIKKIKEHIEEIANSEDRLEIIDTSEALQRELKNGKPKKAIIKSFITSLQSKLPNIATAIEVSAAITELINFAQQFLK